MKNARVIVFTSFWITDRHYDYNTPRSRVVKRNEWMARITQVCIGDSQTGKGGRQEDKIVLCYVYRCPYLVLTPVNVTRHHVIFLSAV